MSAPWLKLNRCHRGLIHRPRLPGRRRSLRPALLPSARCVQRRPHLLEQFLASVRFRDESLEALSKHVPELALFGEAAAQYHRDVLIQAAELIEDRIAI